MKILWVGFLSRNHSWSFVAQNLSRSFIKQGHDVDLFSTNGLKHFPEDLKKHVVGHLEEEQIKSPSDLYKNASHLGKYDMQISYTALKNFESYLKFGNTNKFGIWNYETTVLPPGFAKGAMFLDRFLPSSEFSKQIFLENKIPESKQTVIHHGVDLDQFKNASVFQLKTNKTKRILVNIAQPHYRKNIKGIFDVYGKAFTKNDDVCLVLKISKSSAQKQIRQTDEDFNYLYESFKKTYTNHAEVEIIDYFIDDIASLYKATNISWSMTRTECFWMPGLEAFAANHVVVAPRYGGQLDYMNDENSVLTEGKIIKADPRLLYWAQTQSQTIYSKAFEPSIDDAIDKLRHVVNNFDQYQRFLPNIQKILPQYTWDFVSKQIIDLCQN
jgi:glycosyltransferase involved in cell wall biosynthesis